MIAIPDRPDHPHSPNRRRARGRLGVVRRRHPVRHALERGGVPHGHGDPRGLEHLHVVGRIADGQDVSRGSRSPATIRSASALEDRRSMIWMRSGSLRTRATWPRRPGEEPSSSRIFPGSFRKRSFVMSWPVKVSRRDHVGPEELPRLGGAGRVEAVVYQRPGSRRRRAPPAGSGGPRR